MIFCFSLRYPDKEILGKEIRTISSYTFSIYLIHPIVNNILWRFGIQNSIMNAILINNSFERELLYTFIIIALVFGETFVISIVLRLLKNVFYSKSRPSA